MKLELKHLAGYLPYGLELQYVDCITSRKRRAILTGISKIDIETTYKRKIKGCSGDLIGWEGNNNTEEIKVKPILRPLSNITKEIEVNGEKFVPIKNIFGSSLSMQGFNHYVNSFNNGFELTMTKGNKTFYADFIQYQKLLEWHFDIYGLIENGLAIDINTI